MKLLIDSTSFIPAKRPSEGLFPELRGFQVGMSTQAEIERLEMEASFAMDDLLDLASLESERRDIRYRLDEIEIDVAELKVEERDLEYREAEIKEQLDEMKNETFPVDIQVPQHFGCTECIWKSFNLEDSAEYGAEEHARSTGHMVSIVMSDGSQFFPQDRIDLEVQL